MMTPISQEWLLLVASCFVPFLTITQNGTLVHWLTLDSFSFVCNSLIAAPTPVFVCVCSQEFFEELLPLAAHRVGFTRLCGSTAWSSSFLLVRFLNVTFSCCSPA